MIRQTYRSYNFCGIILWKQADLCVEAGKTALLYVILSPVGPYFGSDFQPIRVAAVSKYVRAWPGGTGDLKMGGNYALIIYVTVRTLVFFVKIPTYLQLDISALCGRCGEFSTYTKYAI